MTEREFDEMTKDWRDEDKEIAREWIGVKTPEMERMERAERVGEIVGNTLLLAFVVGLGSGVVYAVWRFAFWIGGS